jgi:hypothetical protein
VFREAGTQFSPVTMSHPSPVGCYKRPPEGGRGGFCFLGLYFGLFGVGSYWKGKDLLKGKIAEGKRIVEGKMLKEKC